MKNDEDNAEIFEQNSTDEEDEEDEETVNADVSDTDHEDEEWFSVEKKLNTLHLQYQLDDECEIY